MNPAPDNNQTQTQEVGMDKFDVVVVGARCAGSTLAMQLARQGLSVCVAEKTGALGDKPSTHLFTASGTAVLERLGVLDDVLAAGATRLRTMQFRVNDVAIPSQMDTEILGTTLGIRREVLDNVLAEHAAKAGADVRLGCPVDGVLIDDGRVAGVATSSGPVHADLVIGADGAHSTVSKAVGAEEYLTIPGNYIPMWSFFEGANPKFDLVFGVKNGCNIVAPRLDNGLYNVQLGFPMSSADAVLADRQTNFDDALSMCPELVDAVLGATRVGPLRMYRRWHGYFRTPVGPGWALLGDAGHFKDPALGQGMADAFRHGEQLAEGIVRGLGGGDIERELLEWWRWRDADSFEMYFASHFMGDAEIAYTWFNALGQTMLKRPDTAGRILQMLSLRDVKPRHALGRNMSLKTAYIAPRLIKDMSQIVPTMLSLDLHLTRILRFATAYPGHPLGARRYRRLRKLPKEATRA
ncbi:MAG: NAD(P)/FAD-dependent oxidoreductase [Segniliparus sp.]|uniref:NAD(P)/FAD-dependent oxidoreductase n=1 Tax=Segniliparus sp. TaxID=2804064 RepID=UPI003F2F8CBB